MNRVLFFLLLLATSLTAQASDPLVFDLWPGKVPGDVGLTRPESSRIYDSPIVGPTKLITQVSKPTITVYLPPPEKTPGRR